MNTGGANGDTVLLSAANDLTNLQARILTGLLVGPVVLLATYVGGLFFVFLVLAAVLICSREWTRLVTGKARGLLLWGLVVGLVAVTAVKYALGDAAALITLGAATLALAGLCVATGIGAPIIATFGLPYLGVTAIALLWLRQDDVGGVGLVVWLLLAVWATDVAAYAAGRSIGGPRLLPSVSPRKTWAGLIGGIMAAGVVGLTAGVSLGIAGPLPAAVGGAVLGLAAQAGDLVESAIKRRFGVKDTGGVLPGHGGLIDRLDGLFVAAPMLALFHGFAGRQWAWW